MALQGILITNISNKVAVVLSWQESHRFGKWLKSQLHRLIIQRLAVFPSNKIMMCLMCSLQCNICNYNPSIQDEGNTCFLLNTCTYCESHWSLKSCRLTGLVHNRGFSALNHFYKHNFRSYGMSCARHYTTGGTVAIFPQACPLCLLSVWFGTQKFGCR